jgi:hypothetical protein
MTGVLEKKAPGSSQTRTKPDQARPQSAAKPWCGLVLLAAAMVPCPSPSLACSAPSPLRHPRFVLKGAVAPPALADPWQLRKLILSAFTTGVTPVLIKAINVVVMGLIGVLLYQVRAVVLSCVERGVGIGVVWSWAAPVAGAHFPPSPPPAHNHHYRSSPCV